ncbi:MAG: Flp family type IVb pilin [Actinobacteria bacterium]|jgi:pilus assembly protein Flp/PilA|nr:MAG: Flp family type IVb pilin [Actinomycetota bacterium]
MSASFLIGWIKDNIKRQEGQAMAEYGIILALIAAVVIALLVTLGTDIKAALNTLVTQL